MEDLYLFQFLHKQWVSGLEIPIMERSPRSGLASQLHLPQQAKGEISFHGALVAGSMAGIAVDGILFPLDCLKTRLQSAQGFQKAGGFKSIYRGIGACVIGSAPTAALFCVTYESAKQLLSSHQVNEPFCHMVGAGMAEAMACMVRVPTELVKQNMQTGTYESLGEAIGTIGRINGARGFYRGYLSTVSREIPFSFIQFPIWEKLKRNWADYQGLEYCKPYQGAICGSIAGSIAAACTTPFDVIKTRIMLGVDKDGKPYEGFVDAVAKVRQNEGFKAFFKGIGPRTGWIFIGGFVFFGTYEQSKYLLRTRFDL